MEPIRESYQHLKQFTADASHELRNPIALIQTNVQVALAAPPLDPQEQRQQLEVVERLTRRLGCLVDDLLFLTRQDSGMVKLECQPCPLDALLIEVVEEQSAIADAKNITLTLDFEETETAAIPGDDPFTLAGDYDQLARLFTNLISNGIQYTPVGGRLHLALQRCLRHNTPYLQIQVSDSGIGIPENALPYLFDRFYQVDPAHPKVIPTEKLSRMTRSSSLGTGLGLAIVQAIVENHQGQIRVESVPNHGTTFTVLLPQRNPLLT
jgi:OmpR-family two-component system manganese-sensing sensor histidine kinase